MPGGIHLNLAPRRLALTDPYRAMHPTPELPSSARTSSAVLCHRAEERKARASLRA